MIHLEKKKKLNQARESRNAKIHALTASRKRCSPQFHLNWILFRCSWTRILIYEYGRGRSIFAVECSRELHTQNIMNNMSDKSLYLKEEKTNMCSVQFNWLSRINFQKTLNTDCWKFRPFYLGSILVLLCIRRREKAQASTIFIILLFNEIIQLASS